MPAKVKAAAAAAQVAPTELIQTKDIKAAHTKMVCADKQSSQQFNSAENKMVNNIHEENLQTTKQTTETSPVLSSNIRSKYQPPQPDAYVIYPQYQSYVPPPAIHAMSVPGATTIPPGQHQVLQTQINPPFQVAYPLPMNSCEGDPIPPNEQPYEFMSQPFQACVDAQFCQYGWQYQSPPLMSPHQPFPDPCQTFNQFQQATLRTPYGYTAFQGVPPPDPTKQQHRYRSQNQRDPKSSSIASQKGLEYYCNCDCQVQPARPVSMARKEPEKSTHTANIPSTTTERANANHPRSTRSSSNFTKIQASAAKELKSPVSHLAQSVSTMPSSSVRPTESVGNRVWYHRENNLSSDSGWISDNSSNKEDDTASLSPSINEISKHFQHSLCLETSTASSTDESYQDSQASSVSSQCPSTSDDNEQQQQQQHTPTKKHHQQPRIMRAIPSRFVNLLHTAAENAAMQRKRLEGYPLFRQMMLQRRYDEHQQQQDQVYSPDIQPLEFSLTNQGNQGTSWYFPGGYIQFQYLQNPASYIQGQYPQGAGTCVQGPYHQGGIEGYTQGQQGPGCYVQNQQGPGGYNQGSESYVQSQYNQGSFGYTQPPVSYTCSDQQCGQEYCPAAQAVPVYVIQLDNPDVANSCTLYNDGRSYAGYNSQAAYEKQPQSYMYHSNPTYANPVPMQ